MSVFRMPALSHPRHLKSSTELNLKEYFLGKYELI